MLLYSGAVCEVLCYQFLAGVVGGIGTTAGAEVMLYWAGVQNLQNQLFSIAGNLLFAVGLYWIQKSFLHVSWRAMIAITIVIMNLIDMPFTFCTIFDVVRNQYFFLDDFLILSIPSAMAFVVSAYVNVEMAEKGNEGLTYGLFSTANNLGGPVASVIANAVYGLFRPSLSDSANYIQDTQVPARVQPRRTCRICTHACARVHVQAVRTHGRACVHARTTHACACSLPGSPFT